MDRKSRRRIWAACLTLLAMIAVPPLWWATQLLGLPDIGEPFDVKAFQAFTIPSDRNAFVLYRQAMAVLKPMRTSSQVNWLARWSKAGPGLRRWVEANRAPWPCIARRPSGPTRWTRRSDRIKKSGLRFPTFVSSGYWPCSKAHVWKSKATWPEPGTGIADVTLPPPHWHARFGPQPASRPDVA